MKLDDLPYEPDCILLDEGHAVGAVNLIEVPRPYDEGKGWRFIVDCEGELVAIVPADKAETMKQVLNEAYEEHYTDLNK